MRALLLAAGLGTRLRPITDHTPKCMVEINGRPLLDYWLELLSAGGLKHVLVNLHYLPGVVEAFLKSSNHPITISTAFEDVLLGTGGTLLKNRAYFEDGPVMLIHADNLSWFDAGAFINRYAQRQDGIEITMMTFHTDAPESCGIVELDVHGAVVAFHEKVKNPPGNLANGAVYILSPRVLEFIASLKKSVVDFSLEVLPHFMGKINTYHNDVYHRDIGTVQSLAAAQTEYPLVLARKTPRTLC